MNHGRKSVKLQREASHRKALLANLACSLIEHRRIRTTLAKAKALRPVAEKLLTLGKKGTLHARRLAVAKIRDKTLVKKLFEEIAVASKDRVGGYTRITKLGQRRSDSAPMAFIEWVDAYVPKQAVEAVVTEAQPEPAAEEAAPPKKKRATKKAAAAATE
ncbi:MAG: 50S ribosomal protein L17 [Verrucomicrobiaceae bacterium]|nr:50S ribosomal protein L17 [Verrucomicrobiaceae bacterium]